MENKLVNELKNLKQEITPRSEWIALNRDVLLRQINPHQGLQRQVVGFGGYVELFNQLFRQRLMEPAVMMLLVLGVFLGSSFTINAAFYALPGDNLYPVKLALEKSHAAMVVDESKKVELKIEFAQKRIVELNKIVSQSGTPESKKKKIEAVAKEFKNNVASVTTHLAKITADAKPEKTPGDSVQMALTVSVKTGELAKSFDEATASLSEIEKNEVKDIVSQAVESAQETSQAAHQIVESANEQSEQVVEVGEVKGADSEQENTDQAVGDQAEVPAGDDSVSDSNSTNVNTQPTATDESSQTVTAETVE